MKSVKGKRALITGAAGGIGRAIALALARQGAHLWLLDIDAAGLAEVVADARQLGVQVTGVPCDLTRPEQISRVLADLRACWTQLDLLVNNAGVAFYGPTHAMTGDQWEWLMQVNLLAPIQITRELLPVLLSRPEAHVLNVCSISGLVAGGRFAAYHTSKFGLIGFSEALRAEYGRRGLGVTALCPGPVQTGLYTRCATQPGKSAPIPPRWICSSVDQVAAAALTCLYRNPRLKLVGPLAHLLAWTKWLAPGLLDLLNHLSRKRVRLPASEVPLAPVTNSSPQRA